MSTPEGLIRNAIMSYLKSQHIMCWIYDSVGIFDPVKKIYRRRNSVHRLVGLPDIHGILPDGRFLGIECKAKGKYPTKEQKDVINQINQAGGLAFVARNLHDVTVGLARSF